MPDTPEPVLSDLTAFSEATRKQLYEQVAETQFNLAEADQTPDQAGLQVIWFAGRWFATWLDLGEPATLPLRQRFRILRIGVRQDQPSGIELYEV